MIKGWHCEFMQDMSRETQQRDDVFGITRELPKNYVERNRVDNQLRDDLKRGQHVVIYGSSKQGKTCLRKHCLDESEYIAVQCSNNWTLSEIHEALLKQVGYEVTLSEKKTVSGTQKIKAGLGAALPGVDAGIGGEDIQKEKNEKETTELELDPENVNDVIRALGEADFDKHIVLEDFHYLKEDAQRDFAVALKAFHEKSPFKFIIVGVWLEENRLIVRNGDLTGRVIAVNMEREDVDALLFEYKHEYEMAKGTLRNYRKALRKFFRYHDREWAEDVCNNRSSPPPQTA